MDTKRGTIVVSYRFPDDTDEKTDLSNEIYIQQDIAMSMHKLVEKGIISCFSISDDCE